MHAVEVVGLGLLGLVVIDLGLVISLVISVWVISIVAMVPAGISSGVVAMHSVEIVGLGLLGLVVRGISVLLLVVPGVALAGSEVVGGVWSVVGSCNTGVGSIDGVMRVVAAVDGVVLLCGLGCLVVVTSEVSIWVVSVPLLVAAWIMSMDAVVVVLLLRLVLISSLFLVVLVVPVVGLTIEGVVAARSIPVPAVVILITDSGVLLTLGLVVGIVHAMGVVSWAHMGNHVVWLFLEAVAIFRDVRDLLIALLVVGLASLDDWAEVRAR